jgi:hypothetical protein
MHDFLTFTRDFFDWPSFVLGMLVGVVMELFCERLEDRKYGDYLEGGE